MEGRYRKYLAPHRYSYMKKRDYLGEIESRKQRSRGNFRGRIVYESLDAVKSVMTHCIDVIDLKGLRGGHGGLTDYGSEVHRYIPIGAVACMESFFRTAIKDLIDHGSPYFENAAKFSASRDIRFDLDIIQAIQGRRVTVGEFVSHFLPLSQLDDVNSTMSAVLGCDFLDSLKPFLSFLSGVGGLDFYPRFSAESAHQLNSEQLQKIAETYSGVKRAFELRHIFCHETISADKVDVQEIYNSFESVYEFLETAEYFIEHTLDPEHPLTQLGWNERAQRQLEEADQELENLINTNADLCGDLRGVFLDAHEAWKVYREKRGEFVSAEWHGGSIEPALRMEEETCVTKSRINELRIAVEEKRYQFLQDL